MESKHILLTSDLSDESLRAFKPIEDLAELTGSRITLLHVIYVMTEAPQGGRVGTPLLVPDCLGERSRAEEALEKQAEGHFKGLDVTLRVISGTDVPNSIALFAKENDVGLIAISTHGRSGFRRLVLGSVTDRLLRCAHAPVLCFPRSDESGETGN